MHFTSVQINVFTTRIRITIKYFVQLKSQTSNIKLVEHTHTYTTYVDDDKVIEDERDNDNKREREGQTKAFSRLVYIL